MHAHEIFQQLSPTGAEALFEHLYSADRPAYRAAVQILAARRKLRPVFVERKPRPERDQWLREALGRKTNEDAALEVLQAWLLGAHRPMICAFLDELGVSHDGKGLIDDLPDEPAAAKLDAAIDHLLEKNPAEVVAVYLNLFDFMEPGRWPRLSEKLTSDSRLSLSAQPASVE